ncbi:hypothetical protein [Pseudomonas sp. PMCC200344]|uniref:hypothetical protein n=1 Tax=Pseudomonas sp. PMCC200344 TaxID=3042028 RepID=UPI0024B3A516|nr:hypothetical protein [Pseudomonas sp. PMCC200344]
MPFSDIFHPECDPVEPHDAPNHVVFSCLQWKTPSLEVMPQAAKQCFAVMYGDPSNPLNPLNPLYPYISAALERAYILGAMSAVKLIAVHEGSLYLFLDSGVSSATFQEIQSLWIQVTCMSHTRLTVDFANCTEVYSGHSDYVFWQDAKEILESYSLGIEQYNLKALDDFSDGDLINKARWPNLSQVINAESGAIQAPLLKKQNFADWQNFCEYLGINHCTHACTLAYCRKPDA